MLLRYEQAFFIQSATDYRQLPNDSGAEVAFLGRSNAGKSSTINRLTRKGLARTSKTPGRTQLINAFSLDPSAHYRLIDLPGYGFAQAPKAIRHQWPEMINAYLTHRLSLRALVLIIDSRHPPKPGDTQVLNWCLQANLPVHIVATKCDKLSRGAAQAAKLTLTRSLCQLKSKHGNSHVTLQLFSAQTGEGVETLQERLRQLFDFQAN